MKKCWSQTVWASVSLLRTAWLPYEGRRGKKKRGTVNSACCEGMAATAEAALSPACCKPPDGDFVVDRATFQHEFFNLLKHALLKAEKKWSVCVCLRWYSFLEAAFFASLSPGTGMTLPTGVSAFLLECLDADSSAYGDTVATDTTESFPSPETLRDEECSGEALFVWCWRTEAVWTRRASSLCWCDSLGQIFAVSHAVLHVQPGYLVLQSGVNPGLI